MNENFINNEGEEAAKSSFEMELQSRIFRKQGIFHL